MRWRWRWRWRWGVDFLWGGCGRLGQLGMRVTWREFVIGIFRSENEDARCFLWQYFYFWGESLDTKFFPFFFNYFMKYCLRPRKCICYSKSTKSGNQQNSCV